jgi:teichuronic acid biosynthesis glycosyltransferase TuaC
MNVLVISSLYPSVVDPLSGIFVKQQVQELVNQGCQVVVIAPVPLAPFPIHLISKKWGKYHVTPHFTADDNIEVYHPRYISLPNNWSFQESGQRMYAGMKRLISEIAREFPFDMIHAHVALPAGYAAMRIAEVYQKPYLVTIHGADLQSTIYHSQGCKDAIKEVITNSSGVVLVSSKLKRIAEDQFGINDKYLVISNGIDPNTIQRIADSNPYPKDDRHNILSVSNLFESKGIDINLYALERLLEKHPDLLYWIIGAGPEQGYLENLSEKLGISDHVEFLGQLPHDRVLTYMAGCEIFSLPSWQEGFGIVYLEAMAYGKPVVGCLGEGIEDFVVDSETGFLVKPRDVDDVVVVLDTLLDDPDRAAQIGDAAQKHVLDNFTWEENVHNTIELYHKIVHKS